MFLRHVIFASILFFGFASCESKKMNSETTSSDGTYTVSGTIDGLIGTVVLQNNDGDNLSVSADGNFSFATKLADAETYAVTVLTHPTGQSCTVDSGGSGTIASADVGDVVVNCDYAPSLVGCDSGLDIDSADAEDAADAMGACEGVSSASWVLPDGSTLSSPAYDLGHGILPTFGVNVLPEEGAALLALSTGTARSSTQPGFQTPLGAGYNKGYAVLLPAIPGIPSTGDGGLSGGACTTPSAIARDGIALQLSLVVPAGANAFQFSYKFYAADYPSYICSNYVDGTAVLMNSSTISNQNIMLTTNGNPVNVNTADLTVCSPSVAYTCPSGISQLSQTGFDTAAGTEWRVTQAPVSTGDSVTLRFMIWDTLDGSADSTLLIDNFHWYSSRSRH